MYIKTILTGDQMQALSVIGATTIHASIAPLSANTGGTSKSDPNAGTDVNTSPTVKQSPITTKDKAGAGILTILIIVGIIGGGVWIIM